MVVLLGYINGYMLRNRAKEFATYILLGMKKNRIAAVFFGEALLMGIIGLIIGMIMYDVIIIGAGPTGSSAAKELASKGYSALMVEKFKMPRNKSCSGILIQKSIKLISSYFGCDVPPSVMCDPTDSKGMAFINDVGKEYCYEQDGLNIWRSSLDHWLAQKAVEAGVELRDDTTAIDCEEDNGHVKVKLKGNSEYMEQARIVIACDGAVGSIKRKLSGLSQSYVTTYQTFNKGTIDLDPHYFYAFLQPQFSEHDAWFNVKDDYLIFGVSVRDTSKIEHYYSTFIEYMESKYNARIEMQERTERWIMPHIIPGCPVEYGKGRVLFAGETAGFLNPMGEGISAGLECGYAAAQAIQSVDMSEGLDVQALHLIYKDNTASLKTYMERQWRFVANMSDKFSQYK